MTSRLCVITALMVGAPLLGQTPTPPVRDNSFLLEEAYNQERGVVQHISTFVIVRGGDTWVYTFTQEWPVRGETHQFSFAIPIQTAAEGRRGGVGVGDIALNYRYQVPLREEAPLSLAPRLSVLLPTGDHVSGRGAGGASVQVNLPASVTLSRSYVTHLNLGMTYTPASRNALGQRAATRSFNAGQSVIWLARPALNLMLEAVWMSVEEVAGEGARSRSSSLLVAPGLRGALSLPSGLQVVPGIAVPIGVGPSRGERSLFLYLSFEHRFGRGQKGG